ncbi:MAG TPA: hypothetical protein PK955_02035 [Methanoregulaceae archaeon]|nr:hypothetical protein [Methanoregulaceae archaeon]
MTKAPASLKDFDALSHRENRPIRVNGKTITISFIPSIVPMLYQRYHLGELLNDEGTKISIVDLKLQSVVATLNANLPDHEQITEEWVKKIPGDVYQEFCDYVLAPFLEGQERMIVEQQKRTIDLLTPAIQSISRDVARQEIQASNQNRNNRHRNNSNKRYQSTSG